MLPPKTEWLMNKANGGGLIFFGLVIFSMLIGGKLWDTLLQNSVSPVSIEVTHGVALTALSFAIHGTMVMWAGTDEDMLEFKCSRAKRIQSAVAMLGIYLEESLFWFVTTPQALRFTHDFRVLIMVLSCGMALWLARTYHLTVWPTSARPVWTPPKKRKVPRPCWFKNWRT